MKTTHLRLLVLLLALLSLLVVACEEDSDDEGTTDGDEEDVDCLSLTEEQCSAHSEECRTYLARRYTLREDGCLFENYDDGGTQEFASCGSIPPGCEQAETDVLSPNNEFWHFGNYCIPEGWVNMTENDDICETRDCPTEPFCTGPIADGDSTEDGDEVTDGDTEDGDTEEETDGDAEEEATE